MSGVAGAAIATGAHLLSISEPSSSAGHQHAHAAGRGGASSDEPPSPTKVGEAAEQRHDMLEAKLMLGLAASSSGERPSEAPSSSDNASPRWHNHELDTSAIEMTDAHVVVDDATPATLHASPGLDRPNSKVRKTARFAGVGEAEGDSPSDSDDDEGTDGVSPLRSKIERKVTFNDDAKVIGGGGAGGGGGGMRGGGSGSGPVPLGSVAPAFKGSGAMLGAARGEGFRSWSGDADSKQREADEEERLQHFNPLTSRIKERRFTVARSLAPKRTSTFTKTDSRGSIEAALEHEHLPEDYDVPGSALEAQRLRKLRVLNGEGTFWPVAQLSRIFRLFDTDKDGSITHAELTLGLKELGFDITNKKAVRKIHNDIDQDHTGIIRESQFVEFFRNISRAAMRERLSQQHNKDEEDEEKSKSVVTIVEYGLIDKGEVLEGFFTKTEIPGSKTYDVHEALVDRQKKMQRDSKHVRWVDINGQDDDLMDTIVAELQLPLALKEDVSFEQQAKVAFYPEQKTMQFVCHIMKIANFPCKYDNKKVKKKEKKVAGVEAKSLSPCDLVAKNKFEAFPPVLKTHQINLFIVSDHTVVTVRKYTEEDPKRAPGIWTELLDQLEGRMSGRQSSFNFPSAKMLGTFLLDAVSDHNWVLRDKFKHWKMAIDEACQIFSTPYHLQHIMSLQSNANLTRTVLAKACEVLEELTRQESNNFSDAFQDWQHHQMQQTQQMQQQVHQQALRLGTLASIGGVPLGQAIPGLGATSVPEMSLPPSRGGRAAGAGGGGGQPPSPARSASAPVGDLEGIDPALVAATFAAMRGSTGETPSPGGGRRGAGAGPALHPSTAQAQHQAAAAALAHQPEFARKHSSSSLLGLGGRGSGHGFGGGGGYPPRRHFSASKAFLFDEMEDYRNVYESISKLNQEINYTLDVCKQLIVFHENQQKDRMNRTLYILTVVTTVIAPMQLLTGVYGMNFTYMPELEQEWAYPTFWIFNLSIILFILYLFKRYGYFNIDL